MIEYPLINLAAQNSRPLLDPVHDRPATEEALAGVLPPSLARMELSSAPEVAIPGELIDAYGEFRPTPLFEADRFAEAIGTDCLGVAEPFLGRPGVEVVCAESEHCPIVSAGVFGAYSIDDRGFYPRLRTYGLERLLGSEYIGGLGSTIVAAPVADFHRRGLMNTRTFTAAEATKAARLFAETEGRTVALETGYQLAAVVAEARARTGQRILVNISSTGNSRFA